MQISSVARAVRTADGKAVLEVAGRPVLELNSVAAAIWTELSDGATTQEIIARIKKRFEAPEERVATDVKSFVELLKQNHLVKDSVRTQDFHVELIWNKGIAAQCDWRIPDEFPPEVGFGTVLS